LSAKLITLPNTKPDIVEKVETFKDLFDNAHDLIHIVEPDGTILYVNNAWTKVLGYSQREMKGKSIYSAVYPADRERFVMHRQAIINGGAKKAEIVIRMLSKSEDVIYTEGFISSKVIDNVTLYTRGIFRDITSRIQHEAELKSLVEKLREREANLEQLFVHAPDAIVVVDTQSQIRYWNPKAEQIFGWTFNEVSGRSLTEVIIPPKYYEAHTAGMKRYISTGEQHVLNKTIEITALKKDRTEFFVGLTISPTLQNGEPAFIAFIRDIDQQKQNEKELEQQKIQLEQKGRQLEASNSQLEQYAHVASHDMKEPIRKILTFSERLKMNADNNLSSNQKKLHSEN
jgi:two-component system, LuxR family, sensor kinase FixL